MPKTGKVPTWYLLSVPTSIKSQLQEEGSSQVRGKGPCGVGWSCRNGLADPLVQDLFLPDLGSCQRKQPWACWLPGLEFGQWLGTYIVRNLGLCPQTGI